MNKITLFLFCLVVCTTSLLVDPSMYHSFTAPKHALLISSIPIISLLILLEAKELRIGVLPVLIVARIGWLALTNPDWLLHLGNDSFYLHISLFLVVVVVQQFKKEEIVKVLCLTTFLVGIIQVGIGFWQLIEYIPNPSTPIKTPFIGTPNGMGILLVLSMISGVRIAWENKRVWVTVMIGIGFLFLFSGLVLSESRGAWLSLFCVLVIYVIITVLKTDFLKRFSWRVGKASIIIGSTVLIIAVITSLYWINPESSQGRLMIWDITTEMVKDEPVTGVGQGQYSVEYLNYQAVYFSDPEHAKWQDKAANIKQAHNEFLQAFAVGGVLGGILFAIIWIVPLWYGMRSIAPVNALSIDGITSLGIVGAIVIHSLVDAPLHVLPVAVIGYSFLALLPCPEKSIKLSLIGKWFGIILLCGYTIFILLRTIRIYPAYTNWQYGIELASNQQWKAAIFQYSQALDRFGQKGELSHHLGSAYILDEQYSKGIYHLNEAKKDFNDKNIYLSESYANIQLKIFKEAERLAKRALSMFPSHLAPHLLLGEIYYELGEIELSKSSLLKCINEDISIKSPETKQISIDAEKYWNNEFGQIPARY